MAVDLLLCRETESKAAEQQSSQRGPRAHKDEDRENRKVCIPVLAVCPNSSLSVFVVYISFYQSLSSSSSLWFTALSSSPPRSSSSKPKHVIHGKDYCVVSQGGQDDVNLKTSFYMCVNQRNEIRIMRTRQLVSLLLIWSSLLDFNTLTCHRLVLFSEFFLHVCDKDYSLYIRVLTINQ